MQSDLLVIQSVLYRTIISPGFLLVMILAAGQTLLAAEIKPVDAPPPSSNKTVVIPKLQGPIKIDGELEEAVWREAAVLKPLHSTDGHTPEFEQTEIRLWYDDQALFLGWICQDTNIQATLTNRDSHLWEEEAVEFFITPDKLNHYFEFQWNPIGAIFDAVITNRLDEQNISRGYRFDPNYNATNLISAVILTGGSSDSHNRTKGWQVEAMIPFAELGRLIPKPKDVWRGNFFRINRDTNRAVQFSSWAPTYSPWFHQPNYFGNLEFGD
jgi:hypothetical protein